MSLEIGRLATGFPAQHQFFLTAVAASANVAMSTAVASIVYTVPAEQLIYPIMLSVSMSAAITTGTITIRPTRNGVVIAEINPVVMSSAKQYAIEFPDEGIAAFDAGTTIGMLLTASADLTPITTIGVDVLLYSKIYRRNPRQL